MAPVDAPMTAHVLGSAGLAAVFTAGGACLGLGYFALLRRSVAAVSAAGWSHRILALTLVRLGCAAAFFVLAARVGAPALLGGFAGFLGARTLALHRLRNAA
jgi:hypothetical protein